MELLKKALNDLSVIVYNKIISAIEDGIIDSEEYEIISPVEINFIFSMTRFEYDWNDIKYYKLYQWRTGNLINFIVSITNMPEYDMAADEINRFFEIPKSNQSLTKTGLLHDFVLLLARQIPNKIIDSSNLERKVDKYVNDCLNQKKGIPSRRDILAYIESFHFDSEQFSIDDYLLRKPKGDELTLVRPKSVRITEEDRMFSGSISATTILEFSFTPKSFQNRENDKLDIGKELEAFIDILRLYKVGDIVVSQLSITPDSLLEYGHSEKIDSPFDQSWKGKVEYKNVSKYTYRISKNEEQDFVTFFKKMKPILDSFSSKNYLSGSYLDLALNRYKDSLLRSQLKVYRLVSAITCLESLMSNSTSEVTYKISIHVAGVLRVLGFDAVRVLEKMRVAYNVRSTLIHGSKLKEAQISFADCYTHEIVNYARICLLICLQLEDMSNKDNNKKNKKDGYKEELIKMIDHSLIDTNAYEVLAKTIKGNVLIPVLYPFVSFGNELEDAIS